MRDSEQEVPSLGTSIIRIIIIMIININVPQSITYINKHKNNHQSQNCFPGLRSKNIYWLYYYELTVKLFYLKTHFTNFYGSMSPLNLKIACTLHTWQCCRFVIANCSRSRFRALFPTEAPEW